MTYRVVFVRHGESQGNSKNIYTGWSDTPLSVKGEQEAVEAGLCLKAKGWKFDAIYTSVLPRAVKNAELTMKESGNNSVPMVKAWQLNARHSGALQGLTQAEAVAKFGESNVTLWRSSYDVMPACVEPDDPRHPFMSPLYKDVSREELPPGGESLARCVDRVVPFWRENIAPLVAAGKRLLIVGHKNSFRALWKYIEDTPDEEALDMKLPPASAPVVYEFKEVGAGGGLVFTKKYSLNAPSFNPKLGPSSMTTSRVYFLRHGESVCNAQQVHGGWEDSALTVKGERQAVEAGLCLKANGIKLHAIFCSVLQRSNKTAELACNVSGNSFGVPVYRSWKLNSSHTGVLQGLTHEDAVRLYGEEVVNRVDSDEVPPPVDLTDPRHPANSPLYEDVAREDLPASESFSITAKRVIAFWESDIVPLIKKGKNLLIVAHKHSLLALSKHLSSESEQMMAASTLPMVYEFGVGDANEGGLSVRQRYSLSALAPQFGLTVKSVGKAVFLRHGESECNLKGAFTGWEDTGLTTKGIKEAAKGGKFLGEEGFKFDVVFTSVLIRAVESVNIILKESHNESVDVIRSWRLNARHPGVLQGLTKSEAVAKHGLANVDLWRGSYDVLPECVDSSDPRHPFNNELYNDVPRDQLPPGGESLQLTVDRIVLYWRDVIAPRIRSGETVLIVGHKNSLKALFMYLEDTPQHNMFDLKPVSSTAPLVFEFGDDGYSSGITIKRKYWVKHTLAEALAASRCRDGSMHM
uniref:phosphoglycerate mutase (2,3-diphosphoglycerate-dependent) n=1 Tax=Alexandrium catenella TaxID=2925 RepID=A0A7S1WPG7_ALECA